MTEKAKSIKVAAVGDTHCNRENKHYLRSLFSEINNSSDILLLCGDLTDTGLVEEAQILISELNSTIKIPVIAVLGNHDYESNMENKIKEILTRGNVFLLEGNVCEVHGIGFAGVKGFAGGFGKYQLQPWGEKALKNFVQEAIKEENSLNSALAQLHSAVNIALMHYSPVSVTVQGEACEIFPFLGSSRLEEPLNQYEVNYAFHGHAHHGNPEGFTSHNIPVFNVSLPVLKKAFPDKPPFKLVDVKIPR